MAAQYLQKQASAIVVGLRRRNYALFSRATSNACDSRFFVSAYYIVSVPRRVTFLYDRESDPREWANQLSNSIPTSLPGPIESRAGSPIARHKFNPGNHEQKCNPEANWDRPAPMTYGRGNHAVRSERWRYIRCADDTEELYDHDRDGWTDVAARPEHLEIIAEHRRWLPVTEAKKPPTSRSCPNQNCLVCR